MIYKVIYKDIISEHKRYEIIKANNISEALCKAREHENLWENIILIKQL